MTNVMTMSDPYFAFNMGLEETPAQRDARLQADAELNAIYAAQADAYIQAMEDEASARETLVDRKIHAAMTNWAY